MMMAVGWFNMYFKGFIFYYIWFKGYRFSVIGCWLSFLFCKPLKGFLFSYFLQPPVETGG